MIDTALIWAIPRMLCSAWMTARILTGKVSIVVMLPAQPSNSKCGGQRGEGRRQPCGPFSRQVEREPQARRPIIENWFLKPWLAIQARGDPIARLSHGPRDPGVTRFVGTDKAYRPQVAEETDTYYDG